MMMLKRKEYFYKFEFETNIGYNTEAYNIFIIVCKTTKPANQPTNLPNKQNTIKTNN